VNSPNVPSQIALNIRETRRETTTAVMQLERRGMLYRKPDLKFFTLTGETFAFGLKKSK
jgi:hypothetical protein